MSIEVERGQRWRQISTGHEYVVTKAGKAKATFYRRTRAFDENASVWSKRVVVDPDWELVSPRQS